MIFNDKKKKIIDFLKDKDYTTVDEIALGTEIGRTKVKELLYQLKYKKIVETDNNDKHRLLKVNKVPEITIKKKEEEETEEEATPESKFNFPEPEPEAKSKGISAKMLDIEQKLDIALGVKPKKEKKGKLKRFNIGKIKRFNKKKKRAVILMGNDHSLRLIKAEYLDGKIAMIRIGENFYYGSARYIWLWEGKQPVYVLPEWSLEPLCAEKVYDDAKKRGTLIESQIINLRAVKLLQQEQEETTGKKGGNMMMYIGIAIAGIIIAWLFFGGQKK